MTGAELRKAGHSGARRAAIEQSIERQQGLAFARAWRERHNPPIIINGQKYKFIPVERGEG